jgi:steroid delta-isomerase-like uncharacterized protein
MKKWYLRWILPAIVLFIVLNSGCSSTQAQEATIMEMTTLEANKALVRTFNEAVDKRDYNALDGLLTEDFHRHSAASPEANATNREEMKAFLRATEATFPDVQNIVKMMVAEGDMVAVYATFTGTMDGPMGDIPPTGNRVEAPFISFFRIADGKIAEMWVEWDNISFLSQLGLFPPSAGNATE